MLRGVRNGADYSSSSTGARRRRRQGRLTKATRRRRRKEKGRPQTIRARAAHRWLPLSLPDKAAAVIGGENPLCKPAAVAESAARVPRSLGAQPASEQTQQSVLEPNTSHGFYALLQKRLWPARGGRRSHGGGRRPRARSGRPCPYLGLPGGLAHGNRAAHLDTAARKQGGLGPRSAVAFRVTAVHVTGPAEDPGRWSASSPPRPPCRLPARRRIPRTHAHTLTRTALRGVPRPGWGSGPGARAWGRGRAASRAARSRTAGAAAAARAGRGRRAPG